MAGAVVETRDSLTTEAKARPLWGGNKLCDWPCGEEFRGEDRDRVHGWNYGGGSGWTFLGLHSLPESGLPSLPVLVSWNLMGLLATADCCHSSAVFLEPFPSAQE